MRAAATDESRTLLYPSTVPTAQLYLKQRLTTGEARREPCTPRRCRRHCNAQQCSDDGHTPTTTRCRGRISK
jgi:hypothetical protein